MPQSAESFTLTVGGGGGKGIRGIFVDGSLVFQRLGGITDLEIVSLFIGVVSANEIRPSSDRHPDPERA